MISRCGHQLIKFFATNLHFITKECKLLAHLDHTEVLLVFLARRHVTFDLTQSGSHDAVFSCPIKISSVNSSFEITS